MHFLTILLSILMLASTINACGQVEGHFNGYFNTLEYFRFIQDGITKCNIQDRKLTVGRNNYLACQNAILWLSFDREVLTWLTTEGGDKQDTTLKRYYLPIERTTVGSNTQGHPKEILVGRYFDGCKGGPTSMPLKVEVLNT